MSICLQNVLSFEQQQQKHNHMKFYLEYSLSDLKYEIKTEFCDRHLKVQRHAGNLSMKHERTFNHKNEKNVK